MIIQFVRLILVLIVLLNIMLDYKMSLINVVSFLKLICHEQHACVIWSLRIILLLTDVCDLPRETGLCLAAFPRWYFNGSSGLCERFTYGGCQGNRNNFVTLRSCLQTCARGNGIVILK